MNNLFSSASKALSTLTGRPNQRTIFNYQEYNGTENL